MNTHLNKGFIALTVAIWCFVILTTSIALQSEWLSAYMYSIFYRNERLRLKNVTDQCLTYAYRLHISGVVPENFEFVRDGDKCYGKTGDILEATTTSSHFWYATSTKF